MFKSEPIDAVTPTIHPWKKDCWPIAIVAVKTKRHSWRVELKHAGRIAAGFSAIATCGPFSWSD